MSKASQPAHVAIIMDGNGRWAERRGKSRTAGHLRGAKVAKNIIQAAAEIKIENLTLFTFSTENWGRPISEVHFLMQLLRRQILNEAKLLMDTNIKFQMIGDKGRIPNEVRDAVQQVTEMTAQNSGMNLVFAISYGGRQEILSAAQKLAEKAMRGELSPDQISSSVFESALESHFLPDPDLIIRTSGESRLSNFFLWQAAYSEIFIQEKLWPDFEVSDFHKALEDYSKRQRRMGQVLPNKDLQAATNAEPFSFNVRETEHLHI